MELLNATGMEAGYTLGVEPSGREHVVVAVKGTFAFPETPEAPPPLAEIQEPLAVADSFTGEPGLSAPVYEADYAFRKPRCDVLLNGKAYAPGGKPVQGIQVGFKVGSLVKAFNVLGDRVWQVSGKTVKASRPAPFETMPVTYDRAFGGLDNNHPDESRHAAFMPNPVGRGFHKILAKDFLEGAPLPNSQEAKHPVTAPSGTYRPMSFGPVGRGWEPRYKLAGTYDENWLDQTFPFLPPDFDEAYYQAAPADQQIDYPQGGEPVALLNLTPEGRTDLTLPRVAVPVVFFRKGGGREETSAVLDTVLIEPEARRLLLTWRASLPLKRDIFEVTQVLAGRMSRAWWRARELGKTYYPSLGAMARAKARDEEDEFV